MKYEILFNTIITTNSSPACVLPKIWKAVADASLTSKRKQKIGLLLWQRLALMHGTKKSAKTTESMMTGLDEREDAKSVPSFLYILTIDK